MELHPQHWCEEILEGVREVLAEQCYTSQRALLDGEKFINETFPRKNLQKNTVGLEKAKF